MFKTPEEIRNDLGISQMEFCKMIDIPYRTYHERLSGHYPKWTVTELAKLCSIEGKVKIVLDDKVYNVSIKQD